MNEEKDNKYHLDCIEAFLNLLEKKNVELQKKDKIINKMIDFIDAIDGCLCFDLELRNCIDKNCKECIKQYFERKVENGN